MGLAWLAILMWTAALPSLQGNAGSCDEGAIRYGLDSWFHILECRASLHPGISAALDRGRLRRIPGREPVRIASVHNHYQQPGGEDKAFLAEADLLEVHGHALTRLAVYTTPCTAWAAGAGEGHGLERRAVSQAGHFSARCGPKGDVHNTSSAFSPAAYYAAKAEGAAAVQTLHNYRLSCVNGLLFATDRFARTAWAGSRRGRASATAATAAVGRPAPGGGDGRLPQAARNLR